jgi:tetratricopeptide (TPR) repeat protein
LLLLFVIAITDDDIDESLKKKWIEALYLCNDESINDLAKSIETEQNISSHTLKYRGKFYFVIGKYEQALADFIKLLDFEPNNAFALKYQGETYFMMKRYEESLTSLNSLLTINANKTWISEVKKIIIK